MAEPCPIQFYHLVRSFVIPEAVKRRASKSKEPEARKKEKKREKERETE